MSQRDRGVVVSFMTEDWREPTLRPLSGGYSGETFVAETAGELSVVRIYARNPARAAIDASLLRLVRGLVPVPEVLELRHPTAESPGVLVTEYVDADPLDRLLASQEAASLDLEAVGHSVAGVLTSLSGVPFLRFGGFVDAELGVVTWDTGDDLADWGRRHQTSGRLAGWTPGQRDGLNGLLSDAQQLVDDAERLRPARPVLTHSDLNPKNLLVDRQSGAVAAVLDWEFAHAGSMHADLGNFCRFERDPRLVEPLVADVAAARGIGPGEQLRLGRASDLWALVELAARPVPNPVSLLAETLLLAQAGSGDLDAWPWPDPRVEPRLLG